MKNKHVCNLKIKCKGLDAEERKMLMENVRKMNRKRRRNNKPRLLYKIKLG